MKIITLAAPTVVNTSAMLRGDGELRYPSEGSLTVADDEAKRLANNNLLDGDPVDVPDAADEADDAPGDGLDDMKVADLHLLVTKEGVALNDATKKGDIIAAIRKHREEKAG